MTFQKLIFLILLVFSGFILLDHTLFYQPYLAQGDHGRDLYAFAATLRGDLPYRDYWWVYGPLMPFYYAGFFQLFGVSVSSALLGAFTLNMTAAVFVYLTLSLYGPVFLAYLGALWFLLFRPEFFFTFSHVGGIMLLCAFFFFILSSFKLRKTSRLYGALLSAFLLGLVKINFGLGAYVVLGGAAAYHHFYLKEKITRRFLAAGIVSLAGAGLIYWGLLKDLPFYAVRQCLPYLAADHPYNLSVWEGVFLWARQLSAELTGSVVSVIIALTVAVLLGYIVYQIVKGRLDPERRDLLIASFAVLGASYIILNHEFFASGVTYRRFWSYPAGLLMMFIALGAGITFLRRWIGVMLFLAFFAFAATQHARHSQFLEKLIDAGNILNADNARALVQNPPEWLFTVEQSTKFLKETMTEDDVLFALPYDPLYYFLLEQPSPTRQLIFFDHINIPEEQERRVIDDIEAAGTNYVLISNRAFYTREHGLGVFGQTYCPVLYKYIEENFEEIAAVGPWRSYAGWVSGHAVKIFRRK